MVAASLGIRSLPKGGMNSVPVKGVGLPLERAEAALDTRVADVEAFALGSKTDALLFAPGVKYLVRDERHCHGDEIRL